jgi:hypothetical protein
LLSLHYFLTSLLSGERSEPIVLVVVCGRAGSLRIGQNMPIQEFCCVVMEVEEITGWMKRTVDGKRQKTMLPHKFVARVMNKAK